MRKHLHPLGFDGKKANFAAKKLNDLVDYSQITVLALEVLRHDVPYPTEGCR